MSDKIKKGKEGEELAANFLVEKGIIVRDRSKVELCEGCLRVTVGTPAENVTLIESLKNFR